MEISSQVLTDINDLCRTRFEEKMMGRQLIDLLRIVDYDSGQIAMKVLRKMENCALSYSSKNKFISMKWMVFLHEVLQSTHSLLTASIIMNILDKLLLSKPKSKFEEYLMSKLIKPYHQYLKKMAEIVINRLENHNFEKGSSQMQFMEYCEYNLMTFACRELSKPVNEFIGFFKTYYPCLNSYISLLGRDMKRTHKKINILYHKNQLANLTYFEIEHLGANIALFTKSDETERLHSWIIGQTDSRSEVEGNIQIFQFGQPYDTQKTDEDEWGTAVTTNIVIK